mgnify:CR=1 FL=1
MRAIAFVIAGLGLHVDTGPVFADLVTEADLALLQIEAPVIIDPAGVDCIAHAYGFILTLTLVIAVFAWVNALSGFTSRLANALHGDAPVETVICISFAGSHREGTLTLRCTFTGLSTVV